MGEAQSKESKIKDYENNKETNKEKLLKNGKKEVGKKGTEKNKISLLPLLIGLGIGGGALVSVIAAPFVIAGIGFGAGGIAAGSIAAAWMSASGPVAAGSLIAILQSIGAAGMGAASIGVAVAAGGAVGGGIATGVSLAVMNKSDDDSTSYKSKAEELKRLFKDLPSDEWLIADYSCALLNDIFIQGFLYLTTSHLCFYSNANEKEVTILINFRDIIDITKESYSSNILQFQIITGTGKYVFANFEVSDESYELLLSSWKKSRNTEVANSVELIKTITDFYGMNLGFRDTEEVMAYFVPIQKMK